MELSSQTVRYSEKPGIDEPVKMLDDSLPGDPVYTYFSDGLGSVDQLLDSSQDVQVQYAYRPFGTVDVLTGSSNNRYQYTGREYMDNIGLHYYRARFMDSWTGKFLSKDPMKYINLYSYAFVNPVNIKDPRDNIPGDPATDPFYWGDPDLTPDHYAFGISGSYTSAGFGWWPFTDGYYINTEEWIQLTWIGVGFISNPFGAGGVILFGGTITWLYYLDYPEDENWYGNSEDDIYDDNYLVTAYLFDYDGNYIGGYKENPDGSTCHDSDGDHICDEHEDEDGNKSEGCGDNVSNIAMFGGFTSIIQLWDALDSETIGVRPPPCYSN